MLGTSVSMLLLSANGLDTLLDVERPDDATSRTAPWEAAVFLVDVSPETLAAHVTSLELAPVPGARLGRGWRRQAGGQAERPQALGAQQVTFHSRADHVAFTLDALPGRAFVGCQYSSGPRVEAAPGTEPAPAPASADQPR